MNKHQNLPILSSRPGLLRPGTSLTYTYVPSAEHRAWHLRGSTDAPSEGIDTQEPQRSLHHLMLPRKSLRHEDPTGLSIFLTTSQTYQLGKGKKKGMVTLNQSFPYNPGAHERLLKPHTAMLVGIYRPGVIDYSLMVAL